MEKNVARRPRFKRITISNPIRLTDRDKAILSAVCKFRLLTTGQILSVVSGSGQNIVRRLQRLYHSGFLDRPRAQLALRYNGEIAEFVYAPTRKGAAVIQDGTGSGKEFRPVSALAISHTLAVAEALISIEQTSKRNGIRFLDEQAVLNTLRTESLPKRLQWRITIKSKKETEAVGVIPDGFFAVENQEDSGSPRRFYYFLEVDRGTMPIMRKSLGLSSIHRKSLAYSRTFKTGLLKKRFGIAGFKVLFVVRSKERMERMKAVCQQAHGKERLFLFTCPDQIREGNPLHELGMI
ncbi:MAG: replication-relaxation family protein [Verrucomicrobiota bacterium]